MALIVVGLFWIGLGVTAKLMIKAVNRMTVVINISWGSLRIQKPYIL
ncbi:MAG: hypothetical protein QXW98_08225 [Candidatus Caldarchaeum sp.]